MTRWKLSSFICIKRERNHNRVCKKRKRDKKDIKLRWKDYQLDIIPPHRGELQCYWELIYGGALEKAGAKPGDKIVKLNDVEVESIDEIKNFYRKIRTTG